MSELEWRSIGVQQSRGWVHYLIHEPGKCTHTNLYNVERSNMAKFVFLTSRTYLLLFIFFRATHSSLQTLGQLRPAAHYPGAESNGYQDVGNRSLIVRCCFGNSSNNNKMQHPHHPNNESRSNYMTRTCIYLKEAILSRIKFNRSSLLRLELFLVNTFFIYSIAECKQHNLHKRTGNCVVVVATTTKQKQACTH